MKPATPASAAALFATALICAAAPAAAQTYRCVGKDGKKYYSSTIPRACVGEPIELLSPQGTVIRRMDAAAEAKARQEREADAARKREEDAAAKEVRRRNRALLATFTSEKEIEEARARALAESRKSVKEVEQRIAGIEKRQAGYAKEMQFYQDKPGRKPPAKLVGDMKNAEVELQAQQALLVTKKNDIQNVNAKYDDYKKRFIAITRPQGR